MGCLADVGSNCVFEIVGPCPTAGVGGAGTITGVTAGAGLTGGGTTGTVTLDVGAGTGITVAADTIAVDTTVIATRAYVDAQIATTGDITSVAAGNGLTGGGTVGALTIDVGAGTGITVAADTVSVDQTFSPTWTGTHTFSTTDAGTNTVTRKRIDQHLSSGTPAAGFGVGQQWALHSAANTSRTAAQFDIAWIAATDAAETTSAALYLRGLNGAGTSSTPTTPTVLWSSEAGQTIFITDAATNTTTNVLTLDHRTTGTAASNYGTGLLFRGQDASGTAGGDDLIQLRASLATATSGAETTQLDIMTRATGAALTLTGTFLGGSSGNFMVPATIRWGTPGSTQVALSNTANAINYTVSTSTFTHVFAASTAATSGARSFVTFTSIGNTSQTLNTEINGVLFNLSATRQWATGSSITTQREVRWQAPTYAFVGASTMPNAIMHDFGTAPTAGTNATFTNVECARFGGSVTIGATAATMTYSVVSFPAHTVTVTGATQITAACGFAALRLDIVTVTDASAVTVDQMATLYIAGQPAAAGSVTGTNKYAVFVDAGLSRFDGDGTFVFELPADATGNTTAATGRVPIKVGGATKYLRYFDS